MQKKSLNPEEKERYTRHFNIPEIGEAGQIKLKNSSVIIIGAGGLGSASSLYLVAAGIGRIGVVDEDHIGLSNLQRQILYNTPDIGMKKVESAEQRLSMLNPQITIEPYPIRIIKENVKEIIKPYSIVVDATDNFESRYILNDACVHLGKPFVYGAIYHFYGQMSVFYAEKGPCLRCVFKEPHSIKQKKPGAAPGVVGAVPGTIGTLQAMEVIKLILNKGKVSIGRLILYDGLDMTFDEIAINKNSECLICGRGGNQ